ncbi:MAG: hypothetical protein H0W50_02325 [Parachlamydiaceae bacterium]|nr:hypothetical protein [Parachlamydiaceae bacterium]
MTISNTITIFEQAGNFDAIDLPQLEELSIFHTFESILNKYAYNQDPLSKELKKEGRSFIYFVVEKMTHLVKVCKETSDENVREQETVKALKETIVKIDVLKKILKNPFSTSLLVDPWLIENSVTWEKATLDEFLMLGKSFGGKSIRAEPHPFAKEVLAWLDKCPKQLKHESLVLKPEIQLDTQDLMIPLEVKNYFLFGGFNQIIALAKENMEKIKILEKQSLENLELFEMVETLSEMNSEGLKAYDLKLEQIHQSHLLQIKEIDRMLDSSRIRETNTIKVCHETTMITEEMLLKTKSELFSAYKTLEQQRAENRNLCSQIQSCQNQINDLRNQDNSCSIQ